MEIAGERIKKFFKDILIGSMSISLTTMKAKKMESTVLFATEKAAEKEMKVALRWLYTRPKFGLANVPIPIIPPFPLSLRINLSIGKGKENR
jgi:hypothetical protein